MPRLYRSLGPGFRRDIPRASGTRQTLGSPRRRSRGIGVQHGTSGGPCPPCQPLRQAVAVLPFVSRWRLLRSHGHVVLPARGVPGSTPGPGDAPAQASLWAAGCQPNPEPLSPAGPTCCQAAQLGLAEPLPSAGPGSQRLCSSCSRLSSRLSPGVPPIIHARPQMLATSLRPPPETLSILPFRAQDQQA